MAYFEPDVTVVGAGLAGCEAAWQLAERGVNVALVEMKPALLSPAHQTPLLCELVCTNSLRSDDPTTGAGLLKRELRGAGSLVIGCADQHRVPAGAALAVERFGFGRAVTRRLALHPNVRIERRVIDELPDGEVIMATGPLTGGALAVQMRRLFGGDKLYFYDAIAPIIGADSIDPACSFRASRWGKDTDGGEERQAGAEGDYINCPLTREQYYAFVEALLAGRKVTPHAFEEPRYFEGCLPIEVMAERGADVLRHGPMRPVGLDDPRTGRWPFAVIQLRPENRYLTSYNMVGFQTRLAYPEQQRIFSMIPALAQADFLRFGSIHRNTFIDSPTLVGPTLELKTRPSLRFAGLITGVEGYIESCAMGLLAALFAAARLRGEVLPVPPPTTAIGGLYHHITQAREPGQKFGPTNINFGLMPQLEVRAPKRERKRLIAERAFADFDAWLNTLGRRAA
ncbi:MAG TPA: methylenetetrahydrofolate--tRNA-(uracil(54)-C(5))-methyltransferase (FADH(2)-oxidizing) TrmFO [Kofleriaceae bacterium]|nr:methylenetetrahydrofolate--tRNA-(uracil(54)-C(5))-methyltransferase (FADH(2)-oxidizing) TrmFO [Kofleriaceae bacterium]